MRRLQGLLAAAVAVVAAVTAAVAVGSPPPSVVQFVFTSDSHYGLTRTSFRRASNVDAAVVNRALVDAVNRLPGARFPEDEGLRSGLTVGGLDMVIVGGDIANREEASDRTALQPSSTSWSQFAHDYVEGLHTRDGAGSPTRLMIVPGNHEASNAVGFYKTMVPPVDNTALVEIYNRMLHPVRPLEPAGFDYNRDRVFFTLDIRGLHFEFLHVWPDSAMRARMTEDLRHVPATTPVFVVTHDQPDVEAKHFINPNGAHDINRTDQFENLLADRFADGRSPDIPSIVEQNELETFLRAHPNITAYLHGNSNWHQVYEWNGPHRTARLHVVRADSPMKGAASARDETRLSFEVVTVDPVRRVMTVRECLWNRQGSASAEPAWGDSVSFSIKGDRIGS